MRPNVRVAGQDGVHFPFPRQSVSKELNLRMALQLFEIRSDGPVMGRREEKAPVIDENGQRRDDGFPLFLFLGPRVGTDPWLGRLPRLWGKDDGLQTARGGLKC